MKKTIIVCFLFLSLSIKAQDYEFETMTLYSTVFMQTDSKRLNYTSTKNDTYYLQIFKSEEFYEAKLYDHKSQKIHYFKINELKSDNIFFNEFTYEKTTSLFIVSQGMFSKYIFDFEPIQTDGNLKKVKLKVYKNAKKKKSIMSYDLVLKSNKSNLFSAFRISCIHPFEFINRLNINENYIVESAKGNVISGKSIEHKLLDISEFKLILRVT